MSDISLPENVVKFSGAVGGPTVAIFAGVHGDETPGIEALRAFIQSPSITKGTVYAIFANPPAIEKNVRLIGKNLNRCFFAGNTGVSYEDQRARELMSIMDECDAVLDLHTYSDKVAEPFVICEENAFEVARKLAPTIISPGWSDAEPGGTDDYMFSRGKIGVCLEAGSNFDPRGSQDMATTVIRQFLSYFTMTEPPAPLSDEPKKIIQATKTVIRSSKRFSLSPELKTFDRLADRQVIGTQNDEELVGSAGDYIIFPRPQASIGSEAYIIGREV